MTFSARSSEYGLSGLEKTDFHAGSKYEKVLEYLEFFDQFFVGHPIALRADRCGSVFRFVIA